MSGFEVIPVVDLMGGVVVQARAGQRASYRPIRSPLARGSAPEAVLRGLLGLHGFRTVYIADLDEIQARGSHATVVRRLRRRWPDLDFWIDGGIGDRTRARAFLAAGFGALILGSESQQDTRLVEALKDDARTILSLDTRGPDRLGPRALFEHAELWPARIIAMTLGRVGTRAGPDLERVRKIKDQAPDRQVFAAGGVRGPEDLRALEAAGASGVLVATALHDGRIPKAALAEQAI